jgi:hypothetical protein
MGFSHQLHEHRLRLCQECEIQLVVGDGRREWDYDDRIVSHVFFPTASRHVKFITISPEISGIMTQCNGIMTPYDGYKTPDLRLQNTVKRLQRHRILRRFRYFPVYIIVYSAPVMCDVGYPLGTESQRDETRNGQTHALLWLSSEATIAVQCWRVMLCCNPSFLKKSPPGASSPLPQRHPSCSRV